MHIDAKATPEHAARISDAGHLVERIANRQRMEHRPPGAHRVLAAGGEHTRDIAVGHGLARHIDGRGHEIARRLAGRERDHDRLELQVCGALREIERLAKRLLGLDKIDHRPRLHAARQGMTKADHLDRVRAPAQRVLRCVRPQPRDQAGDLASSHIERRNHGGALGR